MCNESRRPWDEMQAHQELEGQRAVHRALVEDLNPTSKYGIICPEHGHQGLSDMQYDVQMRRPDSLWKCPVCGNSADWDDDRYEEGERKIGFNPLHTHPYGEKPSG